MMIMTILSVGSCFLTKLMLITSLLRAGKQQVTTQAIPILHDDENSEYVSRFSVEYELEGRKPVLRDTDGFLHHNDSRTFIFELVTKRCSSPYGWGFSQGYQDCILSNVFDHIGHGNRRYLEFGFDTPIQCAYRNSNTCHLMLYHGWSGNLLDLNFTHAESNLTAAALTYESVPAVFEQELELPKGNGIDYISVDIDSFDIFVLERILELGYQPRVITAEFNANWPANWAIATGDPTLLENALPTYHGGRNRMPSCTGGASLGSFRSLMHRFGYVLLVGSMNSYDSFWGLQSVFGTTLPFEVFSKTNSVEFWNFMDDDIDVDDDWEGHDLSEHYYLQRNEIHGKSLGVFGPQPWECAPNLKNLVDYEFYTYARTELNMDGKAAIKLAAHAGAAKLRAHVMANGNRRPHIPCLMHAHRAHTCKIPWWGFQASQHDIIIEQKQYNKHYTEVDLLEDVPLSTHAGGRHKNRKMLERSFPNLHTRTKPGGYLWKNKYLTFW